MSWCRPVIKHMAQVATATGALYFITLHAKRVIFFLFYALLIQNLVKAWPARMTVKFGGRAEQRISTGSTVINTLLIIVHIWPCLRRLRPLVPHNIIYFRREHL